MGCIYVHSEVILEKRHTALHFINKQPACVQHALVKLLNILNAHIFAESLDTRNDIVLCEFIYTELLYTYIFVFHQTNPHSLMIDIEIPFRTATVALCVCNWVF